MPVCSAAYTVSQTCVQVGDLGLARRLLPSAAADLTGETGTYLYMAPEVMRWGGGGRQVK